MSQDSRSKRWLRASQVRERYGHISDMTLWRWVNDPRLRFPKPTYVNRNRLWAEDQLDEFDAQREAS